VTDNENKLNVFSKLCPEIGGLVSIADGDGGWLVLTEKDLTNLRFVFVWVNSIEAAEKLVGSK